MEEEGWREEDTQVKLHAKRLKQHCSKVHNLVFVHDTQKTEVPPGLINECMDPRLTAINQSDEYKGYKRT